LKSDDTAELFFVHGPVRAYPPDGFEEFFGSPPYYRFIEPSPSAKGGDDVLERIRNFPEGATPEDQMRELMNGTSGSMASSVSSEDDGSNQSARDALDYLYRIMEKEGPFDGIIGYSEGATVAATLILHEQRRFEIHDIQPMFKCALFFAGWPPMSPDLDSMVLADESDLMITIPTCHISKCDRNMHSTAVKSKD
jgi:hypothetical protein